MPPIGATDYRNGAKERLRGSFILYEQSLYGGSIYLGGRAVEGMLRAAIWKHDPDFVTGRKSLETGHDLREILKVVRDLGILRAQGLRESIPGSIQKIGRLWWNNMRFLPTAKIQTEWYNLREIRGKRTMKVAAGDFYEACSDVIRRLEILWQA